MDEGKDEDQGEVKMKQRSCRVRPWNVGEVKGRGLMVHGFKMIAGAPVQHQILSIFMCFKFFSFSVSYFWCI